MSVYEEYVQALDQLGIFREKNGLDDVKDDLLTESVYNIYLLLTPEEQELSRSEAWRAWPERRKLRRKVTDLTVVDEDA